jgi:hypothetical protein
MHEARVNASMLQLTGECGHAYQRGAMKRG